MPKVPPFLAGFDDDDARWLYEHGERRGVHAGEEVIREGVAPEHIYVVLAGELRVSSVTLNEPDLHRARPGEVLGEMSYLNGKPPGASVRAVTDAVLLCVHRTEVDRKIAADPAFGSRFRKVISEFALDRFWQYERGGAPDADPPNDVDDFRVHELIEKLLRGDF